MKYIFCLVFLVAGHVYGIHTENTYYDEPEYDYDHDDEHHYLERPCAVYDLPCIRSFFAKKTGCSPVHDHQPPQDPILQRLEIDIPNTNTTLELNHALLRGFSKAKVKTFLINKRRGSLIFEIVFDSLQVESLKTVVTQYRKGKEPLEAIDSTLAEFRDLSLTLNIRNLYDSKFIKSHVHAYVADPYPLVLLGPGIKYRKKGHSPTLKWKHIHIVGLSAMEGMIRQAPVYMDLFLKTKICDF